VQDRKGEEKKEGDDGLVVLLETLMDLLLGYTLNIVLLTDACDIK
jgi:hypothetical protein